MTVMIAVDAETERLAKKLAEVTGKPLPEIIRQAVEAEAAKVGVERPNKLSHDELFARMMEAAKEFDKLPVYDTRSADEIIGYNEFGLPE